MPFLSAPVKPVLKRGDKGFDVNVRLLDERATAVAFWLAERLHEGLSLGVVLYKNDVAIAAVVDVLSQDRVLVGSTDGISHAAEDGPDGSLRAGNVHAVDDSLAVKGVYAMSAVRNVLAKERLEVCIFQSDAPGAFPETKK